jgi:hypothetical protein
MVSGQSGAAGLSCSRRNVVERFRGGVFGEFEMRTLFGIILGAAITVGAAYMHDASAMQNTPGAARTIVNWDVATEVTDGALRSLRRQVDRLLAR